MGGEGEGLVPEEEGKDWFAGAGLLSDAKNLLGDYNDGADGMDWTFDGVSAGLDILIAVADPFAAAVAAGVGWLLEHVPIISQQWDALSGNPEAIQRASVTWANIAQRLNEQAELFGTQAAVIEGWEGPAAGTFANTAKDFTAVLSGLASDARFLSIIITGVGAIVAALREVVYWAISSWLCEDVIPEAIASLATSWCTFGASVAAFLAWLIISTSVTSIALGEKVGAASVKVAEVYTKVGEVLAKLGTGGDALKFGVEALEGAGKALDNPYVWSVRGAGRQVETHREETSGR